MSRPPSGDMLLVHAHPDDETIGTGATMARYVAEGAGVTLVTCTLGEEGEILVPELEHLAADRDDELGEHREIELADGDGGARRHRPPLPRRRRPLPRLRDDGRCRRTTVPSALLARRPDRGREPSSRGRSARCGRRCWSPTTTTAATATPTTSRPTGSRCTAPQLAAVPSYRPDLGEAWDIAKIYWTAVPRSLLQRGLEALAKAGGTALFGVESADDLPFVVDDALVTAQIEGLQDEPRKMDALRAHRTQVTVDGPFFAMANVSGRSVGPRVLQPGQGRPGPSRRGRARDGPVRRRGLVPDTALARSATLVAPTG